MTTQIKPAASGSYTTVTQFPDGVVSAASTGIASVPVPQIGQALSAINEWVNASGVGSHADLAAAQLAAFGLLIQEV